MATIEIRSRVVVRHESPSAARQAAVVGGKLFHALSRPPIGTLITVP